MSLTPGLNASRLYGSPSKIILRESESEREAVWIQVGELVTVLVARNFDGQIICTEIVIWLLIFEHVEHNHQDRVSDGDDGALFTFACG